MSSNIDNYININDEAEASSKGSSVYVRVIPGNAPTESDTEGSVDSQVSRPECTIKVKVKFGSKQSITEFATVKVAQDDFHECRVYTVDPVKQRQIEEKTGTKSHKFSQELQAV